MIGIKFGLLAAALFLLLSWAARPCLDVLRYWELRGEARKLSYLLNDSTHPSDGSYPVSATELLGSGAGVWPVNPFTGGPMYALTPGQKWQPGAFVYCPIAQRPVRKSGEPGFRWLAPGELPDASAHETVSAYVLVFYARHGKPRLTDLVRRNMSTISLSPTWFGVGERKFDPVPKGIDWSHAAYVLTSTNGGLFL